jgi:sucrose-6-phosphate hydrolase SacC (GH32 family)
MNNWQYAAKLPTSPWRGQMSVPRRLSYISDTAGLALKQEPVIAPLRGKSVEISALSTNPPAGPAIEYSLHAPFELRLNFGAPVLPVFGVKLYSNSQHWTEVGFDTNKKEFYIDRTHSGLRISSEFPGRTTAPLEASRPYDLTIIVDRSSIEAFAQNGTIAMTDLIFPPSPDVRLEFFPEEAKLNSEAKLWELKSIW